MKNEEESNSQWREGPAGQPERGDGLAQAHPLPALCHYLDLRRTPILSPLGLIPASPYASASVMQHASCS